MRTEGALGVHEHDAQWVELLPVSQLYREILREVPRFVPLPHAASLVWTLDHILGISIEPGLS